MDWRLHVPLLNSPVILRQTAGVLIISFLLQSLLISTIFIVEGSWAGVLKTLVIIGLVHLGLAAGALLVMILFFGNRVEMHFRLDRRGALSEVVEARANRAAQLAVLMGLVTGVVGGVLRDIVCNDIPAVLSDHRPYAVCALAGGGVYLGVWHTQAPGWAALLSCLAVTAGLRALALWRNWALPAWRT